MGTGSRRRDGAEPGSGTGILKKETNQKLITLRWFAPPCPPLPLPLLPSTPRGSRRFEESSVGPFNNPVERFGGYGRIFWCQGLLERFKAKDWYERRVIRCIYVRVMPR